MSPEDFYVVYDTKESTIISIHVLETQAKKSKIEVIGAVAIHRIADIVVIRLDKLIRYFSSNANYGPTLFSN